MKDIDFGNLIDLGPITICDKPYLIAEIGINHNGDLDIAKKLITEAKDVGFDAVKFQKRDINIVYSKEYLDSYRESPWGQTQRDQKLGLEFSIEQYKFIDDFCKQSDIDWFVSCWDLESQRIMRLFNTKFNKVASAMATNIEFLEEVAKEKKLTFLSTGMMEMESIDKAVEIFNRNNCEFILMHTVSTYPAYPEELNLKCINTLRKKYRCRVGYSGHESNVSPSFMAYLIGAVAIERHITLDRTMYGSDQSASLEKRGMQELVNRIKNAGVVFGDGIKKIIERENSISKKLRYWEEK